MAKEAAVINLLLIYTKRSSAVAKGLENAEFDTNLALNCIETIYKEILNEKG
jgi:hypothetical protein